ncbi:uncharacterized protein LOC143288193 [Babylonia areolata]|uniref:uncharacterized protein LOC143288193 n=1 Tax=Babylonia areolata TaxID=304850 RepID=UPI003FD5CFE6
MHSTACKRSKWRRLKVLFLSLVTISVLTAILRKIQTFYESMPVQEGQRSAAGMADPNEFVSKILPSHTKPKSKSRTDYASNLRFGHELWTDGKPLLTSPTRYQPDRKSSTEVQEFLARENLIRTPFDTDGLSPYLTTTREVMAEAQRVHFNLFKDLLRGKKYAVLFQIATHENKGDAAIGVGELILLERLGIHVLSYLTSWQHGQDEYRRALAVAEGYPREEVVVLLHGGGNIFGYHESNVQRGIALRYFKHYSVILFPQSIYMSGDKSRFALTTHIHCCNPNLTVVLRDRLSLQIAQRIFNNGTRLVLAPDMAFQVGSLVRYRPPYYDVSWQRRTDHEGPTYSEAPRSALPAHLSMWTWDWLNMPSVHHDNALVHVSNIMERGLGILQTGRVVVTDRLHGHILSTLLDIPHVLLDNADQKLSSYHNTWTRGLANCRLAVSVEEAALFALELLEEYKDVLPERIAAVDLKPHQV